MKPDEVKDAVRTAYSSAADNPDATHAFPVGRAFAESLGYPIELLNDLPTSAVNAFAGVSNVAVFADLSAGQEVLDLGCGAGLDSLTAAKRVAPGGTVIGIDFSACMLMRAKYGAEEARVQNVTFRLGEAEQLPVDDDSVDVALVNGIFNLNPARETIFRELARVVRQGGWIFGAELILKEPLPPEQLLSTTNWFA